MGQLKLIPPTNVLSLSVARVFKGEGKANNHLSGATEPPLPLTTQRLELIKAYAKDPLRSAEEPLATRIPQHLAPRAQGASPSGDHRSATDTPLTPPLLALASGIRTLTAVLVVVALLPNLTLAAFWLRMIDMPWSEPVALQLNESPMPAVQSAIPLPVLSAPTTLEATAGEDVAFPIALDGTDGVPARSIIVIKGLPQGSRLSNGHPHGEAEWNLKPGEIGDLHLMLPDAAIDKSKLMIQLVAPDGRIVADTATVLKMTAHPTLEVGTNGIETEAKEAEMSDPQELAATSVEERPPNLTAATSTSDLVPLPTRRPAPTASDDVHANWIKPSAFVNLRKGPASSAPVVGVVAKGAKLRVVGRKRGWVEVTNPATSERGWVYAGNVDTVR
jgi:Bacterial SH3 domain